MNLTLLNRNLSEWWLVSVGVAIVAAGLLWAFLALVDPAPPKTVRLAGGAPGGAYARSAERIARALEAEGVEVIVERTSGSMDNLDRLTTDDLDRRVDIALVQGGAGASLDARKAAELRALAGLFVEPMWVFARRDLDVRDLRDLSGRTVAMDADGSGVRALAQELLAQNGVRLAPSQAVPLGGDSAARALLAGQVDAAVFVTSVDRPYVRRLTASPQARLVSIARAEAYARRLRYLAPVDLPRGAMDLAADTPGRDVTLVAPSAELIVREDLHPAIQSLLLSAAQDLFASGDLLTEPGVYPRFDRTSFPLTAEAERFAERGGPSLLRSWFPFWAANLLDRLWVLAIPLITLAYPLFKAGPPLYRWQVRRRIWRWYADLRALEKRGLTAETPEARESVRADLAALLVEVGGVQVPLSYADDLYHLRAHIRFIDELIAKGAPPVQAAKRKARNDDEPEGDDREDSDDGPLETLTQALGG